MDITPLLPPTARPVRSYGPAGFLLGETMHEGSVLVSASGVRDLPAGDAEAQIAVALAWAAAEFGIEILLLGTGREMGFVDDTLRQSLRARGIASEVMDTGAACRTYNVLLSEGRRVAAVLLLPV